MHDFSPASMLTLMMANRLVTFSLISLLVAIVVAALNWDRVCYFARRVWHCVPLIGTVSRMARQIKKEDGLTDANGWRSGETSLCEEYYSYYKDVDKDTTYFGKCEDYLSKVCEKGRRTRPIWVMPLMIALLILEAVGFAFVIGPWINRSISSNDLQYLVWFMASFLALISGVFAHIAGHEIHHNSLIKKARHWWRGTPTDQRDPQIGKDIEQISIDNSRNDDKATGYNKILGRIKTNENVTPKYTWISIFAGTIVVVAIAAFWVRTEQLNALETEIVAGYQVNTAANTSSSPFDLPAVSADVEKQSKEKTFEDKIGAEHRASLVTFAVLSVVYVAIQFIALWLSMVYGFSGLSSRKAYETTSQFNTADEMLRWMERERMAITRHANHKLRLLQNKVSSLDMGSNVGENGSATAGGRNFAAFLTLTGKQAETLRKAQKAEDDQKALDDYRAKLEFDKRKSELAAQYQAPAGAITDAPVVAASAPTEQVPPPVAVVAVPAVEPTLAPAPAPAPAVAQDAAQPVKPGDFDDLRECSDDDLAYLVDQYLLPLEQLKRIKATQLILAKTGKFPSLAGATA